MVNSIGIITALNPYIGYAASAKIAKLALATDRAIPDLVVEHGMLSAAQVARILTPEALMAPSELLPFGEAAVESIGEDVIDT